VAHHSYTAVRRGFDNCQDSSCTNKTAALAELGTGQPQSNHETTCLAGSPAHPLLEFSEIILTRRATTVPVYFRIEACNLPYVGAGVISTIFSDLELAKTYKWSLIRSENYRESQITITTVDKDGRAIQL
jgi:hypothetical protein